MRRNVIMSLILGSVFVWFFNNKAEPTITILRDASNLLRGTLPNARLDPSSVTLQGNSVNFSTIGAGLNNVIQGIGMNNSSYTLQGNRVNITTTAQGVQSLYSGNVNASSYTLQGNTLSISTISQGVTNLYLGNVNASSYTLQGNRVDISTVAMGLNRIESSSNSLWIPMDETTPTKKGGFTVVGTIASSSTIKSVYGSETGTYKRAIMDGVSMIISMDSNDDADKKAFKLGAGANFWEMSAQKTGAENNLRFHNEGAGGVVYFEGQSVKGLTSISSVTISHTSMTTQGNTINISTVASGVNNLNFHAVNFSSGGTYLGSVSTFNVIFQTGGSSKFHVTADSATLTIADNVGSGGGSGDPAVNETTHTMVLHQPGDISIATSPFVAIPSGQDSTGKSTWTIINVQGFVTTTGTSTTIYQIAISTGEQNANRNATYMTFASTISANTNRSAWVTVPNSTINAHTFFALHCSSAQVGGIQPTDGGLLIRYRRSATDNEQ